MKSFCPFVRPDPGIPVVEKLYKVAPPKVRSGVPESIESGAKQDSQGRSLQRAILDPFRTHFGVILARVTSLSQVTQVRQRT